MAIRLKQSTASQEFPLGPFLDSTDGVTPETALSIANTDIKLWKMGATSLANKNSGGATHISGGIYHATLDATDTDTLGAMIAFVSVSGALPIKVEFEVVSANVYDALIGGTDYLQVDVTDWKNSTAPAMTGDAFARLGAPAGASVSADIAAAKSDTAAILVDTAEIGSAGAGLTALASAAALATVDSVVDAILVDTAEIGAAGVGLTALASAIDLATLAGYVDTEVAAIKAKTDNLPASPAATGDCLTAAGVRAAVGLAAANLDTQLDALPTNTDLAAALAAADDAVLAQVALVKAKTDALTFTVSGAVDANIQRINDVTITGNGQTGTEFGV